MKARIAVWCLCFAVTAGSVFGVPPTIHVMWDEFPAPLEDVDFVIDDITNPDFPSIELVAGSLTWRVWSEDSDNPSNVGDIGIISSPHPKNFGVTIEDDLGNAGARDVKGIILDPTDAANRSNINGGVIAGNLIGDLFVQPDSFGIGGEVALSIGGDVSATVTIPVLNSLIVSGDLSGAITVTDTIGVLGTLEVLGNVTSTATITIADMASPSFVVLGDSSFEDEFAGDLFFETGLGGRRL